MLNKLYFFLGFLFAIPLTAMDHGPVEWLAKVHVPRGAPEQFPELPLGEPNPLIFLNENEINYITGKAKKELLLRTDDSIEKSEHPIYWPNIFSDRPYHIWLDKRTDQYYLILADDKHQIKTKNNKTVTLAVNLINKKVTAAILMDVPLGKEPVEFLKLLQKFGSDDIGLAPTFYSGGVIESAEKKQVLFLQEYQPTLLKYFKCQGDYLGYRHKHFQRFALTFIWQQMMLLADNLRNNLAIHFDIHPKNILVSNSQMKCIDWDHATIYDPQKDTSVPLIVNARISPVEVQHHFLKNKLEFEDKGIFDPKWDNPAKISLAADLYSFGAFLFDFFFDEQKTSSFQTSPHWSKIPPKLAPADATMLKIARFMQAARDGQQFDQQQFRDPLQTLIQKMMAMDPEKRHSPTQVIQQLLEHRDKIALTILGEINSWIESRQEPVDPTNENLCFYDAESLLDVPQISDKPEFRSVLEEAAAESLRRIFLDQTSLSFTWRSKFLLAFYKNDVYLLFPNHSFKVDVAFHLNEMAAVKFKESYNAHEQSFMQLFPTLISETKY